MMRSYARCLLLAALLPTGLSAQTPPPALAAAVQKYVRTQAHTIVLAHVRVVDGTGAPAAEDRNVIIENGTIRSIDPGSDVQASAGTEVLHLHGYSAMPGIVGMHNHLYYIAVPDLEASGRPEPPLLVPQMTFSAPRLYLANGVTTMRTTGSVETYTDLNLKQQIDSGQLPGPHMDVTGPYLEGANSPFIQMHQLRGPDEARQMVGYWADQGVTSFKAYMNITRAELKAAIEEAHKRHLKLTGHLCSVTYPEAAELGIDDLEHGFFVNTQLDPGKKPDQCSQDAGEYTLEHMDPNGPEATALIRTLVDHHVAVTSTLPVFEQSVPGHAPLNPRVLRVMTPEARDAFLYSWTRRSRMAAEPATTVYQHDLQMERKFAAAGGLLIAGPDPTGNGGVVPGFGDQREIELLVEAGFTPVEAIRIATLNGATYLGQAGRIGSIAPGKQADLMVVKGDPSKQITDVENVEIVFKDGIGYDPAKLLESVEGRYGEY